MVSVNGFIVFDDLSVKNITGCPAAWLLQKIGK